MPNQFRIKSKIPPVPPRVETNSSPQSLPEWKPTQVPTRGETNSSPYLSGKGRGSLSSVG